MVQRYLPKQVDLDKILKLVKRKVLKDIPLPVTVKETQAGYLNSLYIKDEYLYLAQNKLPSHKAVIRRTETLEKIYLLLDTLLFRLNTTQEKESVLLAIPESCVDRIHLILIFFGEHQGVIKTC